MDKKEKKRFCSIECFKIEKNRNRIINKICINPDCKKEFSCFYYIKKSFCSSKCFDNFRRNKTTPLKGKTYEEIYGIEKAALLRKSRTETNLSRTIKGNPKGKSLIELYGVERAESIINKRVITRKQNSNGR